MDRDMELAHLAIAEKAVAEGERHIRREERMIADLDRGGPDTKLALAVLATYRRMQAEHVAHRNRLLKMLQQDSSAAAMFRPGHYQGNGRPNGDRGSADADGS
jgi:hypothetical protein